MRNFVKMLDTWFRIVFWLRVSRLANRSRRSRETPGARLAKGVPPAAPASPGGAPSGVSRFRQRATLPSPLWWESASSRASSAGPASWMSASAFRVGGCQLQPAD
jgi:hypothetical protein